MSCESLKNEQNPDIIEEKARSIYEDYISILSPKEVGFSSSSPIDRHNDVLFLSSFVAFRLVWIVGCVK